jgi:hypothetical protein
MADTKAAPPKSGPPRQAGVPTGFTASQYNIGQFQYPSDLYSNNMEYGGNYVIFYINVAEDSRVLKVNSEPTVDPSLVPARMRGDLVAQNYNLAQTVAGTTGPSIAAGALGGAAAGALGAPSAAANAVGSANQARRSAGIKNVRKGQGVRIALGAAAKSVVGGAVKGAGAVAGTVGVAGLAGATAVYGLAGGKMGRQQKRLKKAIALHVPNQLSVRYSMDWSAEDTAEFQMAATGATEAVKAVTPGAQSNATGTAGVIMAALALSKGPQGAALSAQSGLAANPKKENLFKSVQFRTFSFDYKFFPRNESEAANVLNIIKEFKYHMHPEYKDSNNFVFIYPSEFDIYYYNNGKENLNLNRHTSCVLTDMNVNYTPNSMFNSFENGMPTQIDVTLSFKELAILTKKEIEENY